jgi:heme O synthase-like polyprenyltransferase
MGALSLGLAFAVLGVLQALEPTAKTARRVLLASLLYLPMILALLALDKA